MSKEVLIVEDDRVLAKHLERAVANEGYPVRVVHDGVAAAQAIRDAKPGLVLLDLLIPKRDGHTVLEHLRGNAATDDLPVVIITGVFRGRDHQRNLTDAGASAVLEKPFKKSDLLPHLRRYLGRSGGKPGEVDPDAEDSISLVEVPVVEVLWNAMQDGLTGSVVLQSGKRRKAVTFEAGVPRRIRSNLARECLGNRLLAAGRIDATQLKASLARARAGEGRQGEILVQMGAVAEADVEEALASQGEEKLLELFSWNDGHAQMQQGLPDDDLTSPLPEWSSREMILRGAQLTPQRRVERILSAFADEILRRGPVQLGSTERAVAGVSAVLDRLEEGPAVGDVAAEYPAAVYALRLIGAIAFGEADQGRAQKPGASEDELRQLLESQEGQNHFEVLGLELDAGDEAIRTVFLQLAKRYHPDRFSEEAERELAADAFARISLAHETLSDTVSRGQYLETLRGGGAADGDKVSRIMGAETQFQQAQTHFKKREYAAALEKLDTAIDLNPDEGEFRSLWGWTHFLHFHGDQQAAATAREAIERGIQLSPKAANGFYYMGMFRKACEQLPEAERMFKKVLELDPRHSEAQQELRVLNMRKSKEQGSEGLKGMLSFGRKK